MPPKYARLAGLGAFGACAGLLGLYLILVFVSRPTTRGGIDSVNATVAWIALGGLFLALILAHIVIGRQLLRLSKGEEVKHPL
jgi:membrane associated rhomboid family serine protease